MYNSNPIYCYFFVCVVVIIVYMHIKYLGNAVWNLLVSHKEMLCCILLFTISVIAFHCFCLLLFSLLLFLRWLSIIIVCYLFRLLFWLYNDVTLLNVFWSWICHYLTCLVYALHDCLEFAWLLYCTVAYSTIKFNVWWNKKQQFDKWLRAI